LQAHTCKPSYSEAEIRRSTITANLGKQFRRPILKIPNLSACLVEFKSLRERERERERGKDRKRERKSKRERG
jgi:hypothetical protein